MRQITAKYASNCRACDATIAVGQAVAYEKRIGVFCPTCEPSGEALREYRQEALDRRNERLEQRAASRRSKADELYQRDRQLWQDHAFVTQPGIIPERTRAIRRRDKACELMTEAAALEQRASRTTARVKGDAAKRDEAKREAVRQWIQPGMTVRDGLSGPVTIIKVNRKTAKVQGQFSQYNLDLIFIRPEVEAAS